MKHCKPGLRHRQESKTDRVATLTTRLAYPTEKLKPRDERRYVHAVQLLVLSGSRGMVKLSGPKADGPMSPRLAQRRRRPA